MAAPWQREILQSLKNAAHLRLANVAPQSITGAYPMLEKNSGSGVGTHTDRVH